MAKIMAGELCIMHDAKENVEWAYRAMVKLGANVNYMED